MKSSSEAFIGATARPVLALLLLGPWMAQAQLPRDAVIQEIQAPASLAPGESGAVRVRVQNTGTETWTTDWYRLGATFAAGEANEVEWLEGPCGGYFRGLTDARAYLCRTVAPGQTYDFEFSVRMPQGVSGSRRFGVKMVRDGLAEGSWFGTPGFRDITVRGGGGGSGADVVVTQVWWTPASPQVGQQVQFHATVLNQGNETTGDIVGVGFSIGGFYGWGTHPAMGPGQTATISMDGGAAGNRWIPSSTGTFTVTAVADDINRFPESDETNNNRSAEVTVGGAPQPQADVVVTEVTWTPAQPEAGKAVQFHARVVNQGTAVTGDNVGVGFSIGAYYGWGIRAPMQPGESALISMTGGASGARWFPSSAGSFQVTANADDINRFPESNEGNNARQAMITVNGSGGGGEPRPGGPNKFGIGMLGYGHSGLYDRARDLVGEGGWVLAICPELTLASTGASEDCQRAVREITSRGQNVIVRLAPPWGNRMIRHEADPNSNRQAYTLLAAKYKAAVEQLLAAMGGTQRTLAAQVGNELNLCYEWESSEEYGWETMAREVAAFQRDVANALQTLSDSRLVVVSAPLAPGGAGRCVPVGDDSPGPTSPAFIQKMVEAVPGLFQRFDGFGSHPYPAAHIGYWFMVPFAEAGPGLHVYRDELQQAGVSLPVYATETGWPSTWREQGNHRDYSHEQIGEMLVQAFTFAGSGWMNDAQVTAVTPYILEWSDEWQHFAWLDSNLNERAQYHAVRSARCQYFGGLGCNPVQTMVGPGMNQVYSVVVPAEQTRVTFSTSWPGSDVVMTLTAPSGRVISRSTTAPDVTHAVGATFETYQISNPEPGPWQVNLFGADIPAAFEPVALNITAEPHSPGDTTGPEIVPVVTGTAGANGWYVSNVAISFRVNDPESGIASTSGCGPAGVSTETRGSSFTCWAENVSGLENSASVTVKVDKTPPSAGMVVTQGTPGLNGWYTSNVTVTTSGADSVSYPVRCTPEQYQTEETPGTVLHGFCTNDAGLQTSAGSVLVKLDKTPPVLSGTRAPPPNPLGWNNTDVAVTFSCSDAMSGVGVPPLSPQLVTTEGLNQSRQASCADQAGLVSQATVGGISIDKTAPTVTITSPAAGDYVRTEVLRASWTAADALSGIHSEAGTLDGEAISQGQALDLWLMPLGTHTVRVTATDKASNASSAAVSFRLIATLPGLIGSTERACSLGWIARPGVCNSLLAKLSAAQRAVERGQKSTAENQLSAFLSELRAQRGHKVSEQAYTLLAPDAEYVREHL